jgi:hypothetical protein
MAQNREIGELGQIVTVDTSANSLTVNGSVIVGNSSSNVVINSTAISFSGINQTDKIYIWTNTHTFTNTVSIMALSANGLFGAPGQALYSNGSSTYWANVTAIAGSNTQIQFNDSGFANGSSSLIFNKDTKSLQVSNVSSANILQTTGGTESTKPSGAIGMIRYNSNNGFIETYTATGWATFAIGIIDYGSITDTIQMSLDFGGVP